MNTRPFAGIAAGALVILLGGCAGSTAPAGSPGAGDDTLTIAGVYESTQDAFWAAYICGAQARADELGVNFEVFANPTADNQKLGTALDSALLIEPDGILFNPIDDAPWDPRVGEIMQSGVPVVTPISLVETQLSYAAASQDATEWGDDVTDIVSGESGTAVVLKGLAEAEWQNLRLDGIRQAITDANPDLRWLDDQIDGFDVNKGTQQLSSLIVANPDLKVILAVAGPEGQAAAAAVKQTGADGVHVIAFDSVPAEVDALRDGTIDLLIAQPAFSLGAAQLDIVTDFLNEGSVEPGQPIEAMSAEPVKLKLGLITRDNVDDPATQEFIYNPTCQ